MNSDRTQTGIPIIHCPQCRLYHPQGRRHCKTCGKPSLFINERGYCFKCGSKLVRRQLEMIQNGCTHANKTEYDDDEV